MLLYYTPYATIKSRKNIIPCAAAVHAYDIIIIIVHREPVENFGRVFSQIPADADTQPTSVERLH